MTEPSISPKPAQEAAFPAVYESLEEVREFVGQAAEDCGLQPAAVYAVQMAVDEAFTNIIEHAFGGECQETIECACRLEPDQLVITLKDCGDPFDPTAVPDPDLDAPLEEREIGGLGLFFMRNLMDEVHFEFRIISGSDQQCNTLTMVKRKEPAG